jgi:hypothetical protein
MFLISLWNIVESGVKHHKSKPNFVIDIEW